MKVKWSGMGAVDGRGKINGTVGSRNRAGAYLRVKVTPVNPQTVYQLAQRALLAGFSQAWRTLTQSQRDGWDAAVGDYARTDIFGDLRNPTGKNLFTRLNTQLSVAGESGITDAPLPEGTLQPILDLPVVDIGTPDEIEVATTTTTTGNKLVFEATPGVSPGKKFLKNDYRVITAIAGAAPTTVNLKSAYNARFGVPPAGTRVGFRCYSVNPSTGERSVASEVNTIVLNTP